MSTRSRVSVQSSEASSWSELETNDTLPLVSTLEPSSLTGPIPQPVPREPIARSAPPVCVAQEIDPSISLSRLLTQACKTASEDLDAKIDKIPVLIPLPALLFEPEPVIGIPGLRQPSTSAIDSEYSEYSEDSEDFEDLYRHGGNKHERVKSGSTASLPLTVIVDAFRGVAFLFGGILWGSARVFATVAYSTFTVLKCSLSSDWVILVEVLKVWLLFAHHIYTAVLFSTVVILLKLLSAVGWAVGFFDRRWPTREHRELVGPRNSKPPILSSLDLTETLAIKSPGLSVSARLKKFTSHVRGLRDTAL